MKRFIVVGLGNFGYSVAESLFNQGHEVIAISLDAAAVDRIATRVSRAAVGNGTDLQTLERIGAKGADAGVVSTGDDITASILATVALHDLDIRDVYVKVISRDHARVMERIGVTETVFPERDSALSLGRRMSGTALLNYVRLGTGFSVQEMGVPQAWYAKTLRELGLRQRYGVSIVAVRDVLTDEMRVAPDPDAKLKDSDTLLIAGTDEDLARVAKVR